MSYYPCKVAILVQGLYDYRKVACNESAAPPVVVRVHPTTYNSTNYNSPNLSFR